MFSELHRYPPLIRMRHLGLKTRPSLRPISPTVRPEWYPRLESACVPNRNTLKRVSQTSPDGLVISGRISKCRIRGDSFANITHDSVGEGLRLRAF